MDRIPLRYWNLLGCLGLGPGLLFIDPAEVVVILWTFLFMSRERDRERQFVARDREIQGSVEKE
jgi:hypothetical protein